MRHAPDPHPDPSDHHRCCGQPSSRQAAPPSHAEPIAHETELLRLTLTPAAQRRLGIEISRVGGGSAQWMREVSGEVVVRPRAPMACLTGSLSNLQQIGAQQATADGEVARIALNRAESLVREEAGSVRARDEAAASLGAA